MTRPAEESAACPAWAYVTPAFPCVSAVFEQNELTGLVKVGVELTVLSCRRPSREERERVHAFARPLLDRTEYAGPGRIVYGLAWCLFTRPLSLGRVTLRALGAAFADPRRLFKHAAAWALAVAFAPLGARRCWDWLHADFVQGSATVAWHLSELLGVPFSMKAHAFDLFSERPGERERDEFFERKFAAAAFVACEHGFGLKRLAERFGGEFGKKMFVHRTAQRTDECAPLPLPTGGRPKVVALGRLTAKKGLDRLVRAVGLLRERGKKVACDLYGGGEQEAELRRLVSELRLEKAVRFRGWYAQEQLPEILREATAVAVPSVPTAAGDMDGIPTVIYDAMTFGRPVVASALSGIPEAVAAGETGLLTPPGDVAALADALERVLFDRETAEKLSRAARAFVERRHDRVVLARELLDLARRSKETTAEEDDEGFSS